MLARWMHAISPRATGPFVHVYMTGVAGNLEHSELFGHARGAFTGANASRVGRIEAAHGGMLLLDEIGDAPPALQGLLLEALEHRRVTRVGETVSRQVDVQLAGATNQDIDALAAAGQFRHDLLDRFGYLRLRVPPLRERRDEIIPLTLQLLRDAPCPDGPVRDPRISPALAEMLLSAPWPGNVRQLYGVCDHLITMGRSPGSWDVPDLPREFVAEVERGVSVGVAPKVTRADALAAIEAAGGNKTEAARRMQISRQYLYEILRKA